MNNMLKQLFVKAIASFVMDFTIKDAWAFHLCKEMSFRALRLDY